MNALTHITMSAEGALPSPYSVALTLSHVSGLSFSLRAQSTVTSDV